jgi:hypothetical protein
MLKRFENDQGVAAAGKDFEEAQENETVFGRDFDGMYAA